MLANIIRMLLCAVIGLAIILSGGNTQQLAPSAELIFIAALSGVSTAVFAVTWLISVKDSAYMMLNVFLMLGLLFPLIAGDILFHEAVTATQWLGIAILFVSVIIMCSYNNGIKGKLTLSSFMILLLCGFSSGITDFSQKLFTKRLPHISISVFNFYTYLFAAFALVVACFLLRQKEGHGGQAVFTKIWGYIFVMSICLFLNSYFKTLAAEHMDTVLLYPLNQGAGLILSTAMSATLFHEKLTAKCVIGLLTAFVGLLIINAL